MYASADQAAHEAGGQVSTKGPASWREAELLLEGDQEAELDLGPAFHALEACPSSLKALDLRATAMGALGYRAAAQVGSPIISVNTSVSPRSLRC